MSETHRLPRSVEHGSWGLCSWSTPVLRPGARLWGETLAPPPPPRSIRPHLEAGPTAGRSRLPPRVCCSGKSTASTGLHLTNGELIATLDSQVYKYVKSILIVFSKTGKQSILSDVTSAVLTGAVVRRPGGYRAPVCRPGRASVHTSPCPVTDGAGYTLKKLA